MTLHNLPHKWSGAGKNLSRALGLLSIAATSALAESALPVEFVPVRPTELTLDVALTGTIHAADKVDIGFPQGGRITEVAVREGDTVQPGQLLARIDPLQYEQAVSVAQAAVEASEATEAQARQAQIRAEEMLRRGVGTRAALDEASQRHSAAVGALAQARTALSQAQRSLEDTRMLAPSHAIVTARKVEPGQIVGAAQAVISLASATGREAVFQTPDSPLLRHAIGTPVTLEAIDFPDTQMTAQVTEIAPLVDPATGSVTVRAEIDNAPLAFDMLGAAVRGLVHFPTGTGIAVPWTALTASDGSAAVWIITKDGTVELAPVTIERFSNGTAILGRGVRPSQIVVGAGSQSLYPGRKVVDGAAKAKVPE